MFPGLFNFLYGGGDEKKKQQQPVRVVQSTPRPAPASPVRVTNNRPAPHAQGFNFDPLKFLGEAANNIGHVANDVIHAGADVAAKGANTVGIIPAAAAGAISGDRKLLKAADDMARNSWVPRDVLTGKATPLDFAKSFTNAGVQTANFLPAGGAAKGLAAGLTRAGARNALVSNAKQAAVFGTANTANDAMQGRAVTPQSLAANYVAPATLGAGSELAGAALRSGARGYMNAGERVINRPGAIPAARAAEGGYARVSRSVGPDGNEILRPYVSGTRAQSKEYGVPVSTPETRRRPIDVKAPRSKEQRFVMVNTLDNDGKPTFDLVPLDNRKHTLSNGRVTDKKGNIVGSYLGVDASGNMTAYVEGKPVNINKITGNLDEWGNLNKSSHDMDRLIEANAPNKETARRVQQYTTQFKDQQEALMKTDLKQRRQALAEREKAMAEALPRGISKDELSGDLFRAAEKKADLNLLRERYGGKFMDEQFIPTLQWSRQTYDELIGNANNVLKRNGLDEIPLRDNYITHIQDDPTFWEKFGLGIKSLNPLGSSVSGDINPGSVRGGIPDEIVGNTANTAARRKFNQFAQQRKGTSSNQDFFAAHDSYYEPILHNTYMTPAASRARVVEKAFRANDKARQRQLDEMAEIMGLSDAKDHMKALTKKTNANYEQGRRSPFVMAWQEYGNQLAGKTNAIDRAIIDSGGKGAEKALNASTKLQGIAGASAIPGSTTAALAQVLSLPQTIARDSPMSVLRGAKDMMQYVVGSKNDPLRQSAFMRARYTDASSLRRNGVQKYTHAASKPMEIIERASGELSWRSAYNQALKKGLKGHDAIREADLAAKKTLAGRGIGDRPMVMNSKALGLVTQFGLEVNNMRIQFWKDFTPVQKIKFLVAAAALNSGYSAVTGNAPLPDYAGAIGQSINDFSNSNDDKKDSVVDNSIQAGQRLLGETSKFVPGASLLASGVLSDTQREQVFGKNGDLSRYGTPALAAPISNTITGLTNAVKGDMGGAFNSLVKLAPTGNQVSRSVQGASVVNQGYQTDAKGNVQSVLDQNNPAQTLQALMFGRYSLPGQQQAMDSGFKLAGKESAYFKKMYDQNPQNATNYFNTVINKKIDKSDRKGSLTNNGQAPTASAASIPDAPYAVQSTSKPSGGAKSNVAQSTDAKSILDYYDALPSDQRKEWNNAKNTDTSITDSLSAWTGKKVKIENVSNALARKWAQYQKDYVDGKVSKIVANERKRSILNDALTSQLDDTEKAISHLSKGEIKSYAAQGAINKDDLKKVLEIEKAKFDAGLITRETFAKKLGLKARGYKAKKAKSRKAAINSFKAPASITTQYRLKGAEIARNAGLGK